MVQSLTKGGNHQGIAIGIERVKQSSLRQYGKVAIF